MRDMFFDRYEGALRWSMASLNVDGSIEREVATSTE